MIVGWVEAMAASSALFVFAKTAAGALDDQCRRESPHLEALEMVILLIFPTLPDLLATLGELALWSLLAALATLVLLAVIVWRASRGSIRRKECLDMAPSLFVVSLVCAFIVPYAAGWLDACGMLNLWIVASLASVGVVLSSVVFGVYLDVYHMPGKEPFRNMAALVLFMAAAAFAYYALQVDDVLEPLHEVVRQLLVTFAMVAVAVMVGVFGAEYGKNRGQSLKQYSVLSFALISVGIVVYSLPSDADVHLVVYGIDIQEYIAQTLWAGITVLAAIMAMKITLRDPTKFLWFWIVSVVVLAFQGGVISDIQNKYVTLPPNAVAMAWVGSWQVWVTLAPAFLGSIVACRMRAERDGAPPRHTTNHTHNCTAGPPLAWPILLCDVARRDEVWGMLRPYVMRPPPHVP